MRLQSMYLNRQVTHGRNPLLFPDLFRDIWNNKLDVDQLQQLLHTKDIFSLQDVEYANLEEWFTKSSAASLTFQDLNIEGGKRKISLTIISDDEIMLKNLKKAGVDKEWLYKLLDTKGINDPKEIIYAEWEPGGSCIFKIIDDSLLFFYLE
jgi:uncharacterized membrane protein YcaP (DUF421 family)